MAHLGLASCLASAALPAAAADTIYYRLNVMKGGQAQDHVEPGFKKLNAKSMPADGCIDHRPAK